MGGAAVIYILIILFASPNKAGLAVEFNNMESCHSAAAEISKQAVRRDIQTLLCAQKGKP